MRFSDIPITWCQAILTRQGIAFGERISGVVYFALTDWAMSNYSAFGINSTSVDTWVFTFHVDASFVSLAFWTDYTFWVASRWSANVIRQTWAYSLFVYFLTSTVGPTWRWSTNINRNFRRFCNKMQQRYEFSFTHNFVINECSRLFPEGLEIIYVSFVIFIGNSLGCEYH